MRPLLDSIGDRRLIYGATAVRSFGYGFVPVVLGLYLDALGHSPLRVGLLLSTLLAGRALLTLVVSLTADRMGRKRTLIGLALLTAFGGVGYALWPIYGVMVVFALTGGISPSAKDRGAFTVLEQSILPQTGTSTERNWIFARYNFVGTVAAAVGALATGLTSVIQGWGFTEVESYRALSLLYAVVAVIVGVLFASLSSAIEPETPPIRTRLLPDIRSKGIIGGLAGLFALDAFGGGLLVQSFLSYWFHIRYGLSPVALGTIFFLSGLLTSASYLVAARLAGRIGLINTMVFTHLPSNVLLMLVPLAPTVWGAITLYLAREALSQMDVPTRQSYVISVVGPDERTSAAGATMLSRNAAQSISPPLGGYLTQIVGQASPFLLCGLLKVIYDISLYFSFRGINPPEEVITKQE